MAHRKDRRTEAHRRFQEDNLDQLLLEWQEFWARIPSENESGLVKMVFTHLPQELGDSHLFWGHF